MAETERLTELCEIAASINLLMLDYAATVQQEKTLKDAIETIIEIAPRDISPKRLPEH